MLRTAVRQLSLRSPSQPGGGACGMKRSSRISAGHADSGGWASVISVAGVANMSRQRPAISVVRPVRATSSTTVAAAPTAKNQRRRVRIFRLKRRKGATSRASSWGSRET